MLSSNMLLLNLILLIDVTFSTPTPDFNNKRERIPCLPAGDENPRRKTAALYAL